MITRFTEAPLDARNAFRSAELARRLVAEDKGLTICVVTTEKIGKPLSITLLSGFLLRFLTPKNEEV